MPKKLIVKIQVLNADLTIQNHERLRLTLDTVDWPSFQQKLLEIGDKKCWGKRKFQYHNGTARVELCDPGSMRCYLELHQEALLCNPATLSLDLVPDVPDPTDDASSFATDGKQLVLEVDREGSPGNPVRLSLESGALLGQGGFGQVRWVRDSQTQVEYAVKSSLSHEMSQKSMRTEISTLLQLNHPNIVKVSRHGYVLDPDDPLNGRLPAYMMDLGRCSVQDLIDTGWHHKAAAEAAQRDVSAALQHFHAAGLGHMDVKPDNWLVTNKFTGPDGEIQLKLKLIDAGGAGRLNIDYVTSFTPLYGHPLYQDRAYARSIVGRVHAVYDQFSLRKALFLFEALLTSADSGRAFEGQNEILLKASEALAGDRDFVMATVRENGFALNCASQNLQSDEEIVMEAVRQHGAALRFASKTLQNSKKVVMEAVQQHGPALEFASLQLRGNKEVVLEAVRQNGWALAYTHWSLLGDKEVVMEAVQGAGRAGYALTFAMYALQGDKEIVLKAVQHDGAALACASPELQSDKEIVMEAVRKRGGALKYACKTLQAEKEIVMEAVRQNGWALEFASKTLQRDKDIVMEAVHQDGRALQFASKTLQSDKDVVMEAVHEDGRALQFASKTLQSDKDVVMEAVQQDGRALQFASKTLQSAIQEDSRALQFAVETLRSHQDVLVSC